MKKKLTKESIIFIIVAVISAGLIIATAQIGTGKYYPITEGRMQIIFFGDSNLAYDFDGKTIANMVAERIECDVYNCAVGGTTAAKLNTSDYFDKSFDLMCFYNLTKIMEAEDHTPLRDYYKEAGVIERQATGKMEMLVNIEYEKVDYVVISYGLNDYTSACPIGEAKSYDESTYEGALRSSIDRINKLCPNATIIVSSITYCIFYEDGRIKEDGYERNWGGGCIDDYRDAAQRVSEEYDNVIFMDNLELLGINETNHEVFLRDGMHFTVEGQQRYTECLLEIIMENENN